MDKRLLVVIVVIVLLAVAGGGYVLVKNQQSSSSNTDTMSTMNTQTNNSSNSSGNESAVATDKVTIANFAFSPANITVKKGTTVTWTNSDSTAHTVTESDGKAGPDSSALDPGSTYTFTFKDAGTFQYHCSIHPSMTGTVVVTE